MLAPPKTPPPAWPSEYIRSGRIYFSCEGGETSLPYAVQRLGHKVLVFASDFPHETNLQRAKHEVEELMEHAELTDEAKQGIFHDNFVRFYGPRLMKQEATVTA